MGYVSTILRHIIKLLWTISLDTFIVLIPWYESSFSLNLIFDEHPCKYAEVFSLPSLERKKKKRKIKPFASNNNKKKHYCLLFLDS